MTDQVTDVRSNSNDQIAHAVSVIGRSSDRLRVFLEFHRGKKKTKTVTEVAVATGLKRKRVLEEAMKLSHKQIIHPAKRDGEIAYERDDFLYANRSEIVRQIKNPTRRKSFPTKYNKNSAVPLTTLRVQSSFIRTATITIDDIGSFSRVRRVHSPLPASGMKEKKFKEGIQKILKQPGKFKDWGGEKSDLYTNRLTFKGKRISTAFAFKGRGTKGELTPARLGKNGDQIQRLFGEDAEIFLIQYHSAIASSVIQLMAVLAQMKSVSTGKKIYYGTIDGGDTGRLLAAYPWAFK